MKNKLEHILLSILLGLSVLLGLSFWLNTIYNFNIFCATHWGDFAKLQALHTPISIGFYASFIVAILIFTTGLYFIYRSTMKNTNYQEPIDISQNASIRFVKQTEVSETSKENKSQKKQEPSILYERPPRLNLPTNTAQIAKQKFTEPVQQKTQQVDTSPYNPIISDIFSANGYVVKPNPKISGFIPNLFAIGNNEILWIGGADCDIEKMMTSIQKLDSVFKETLQDIPININAFILDTLNKYDSTNAGILVFKSIDELKSFINEHPADQVSESDKENFDAYSEYIDTIIQYIKNL